ncbi:MAG: threonine synthase, partial [Gemmatimonadetes bacterium]|nr:threonine synthase [Gemmatimonadota bacterium]
MTVPPLYTSTRGHGPVALVDALLQGLAPDGGLYLPEGLPALALPPAAPLADIGPRAVAPFLPDGDAAPVGDTFAFDTPLVAAEKLLGPRGFMLDLTRGPTAAFKDVGARFLARVLST